MSRTLRSEVGSTVMLYTLAMVAMMGMAALAIDLGMLRKARAEAQRAADAAALAGASAFLADLTVAQESTNAVSLAYRVADTNYMNGVKFDTTSEITVWVIPDSVKVRVKARREAVPTWFARVFGINSLPVGAVAAAEASYAGGTKCVKPIAMPDVWEDIDNDTDLNNAPSGSEVWLWTTGTDLYNPAHYLGDGSGQGLGSDWRNVLPDPNVFRDWGRQVVLQPSVSAGNQACIGDLQGNKCYVPGWWGWWGGSPKTREAMLKTCDADAPVVSVGETIEVETGWTQALRHDIRDVINMDPGASWNPAADDSVTGYRGTVVNATLDGATLGGSWRLSKRVWIIAMVAPGDIPAVPSDHDTVFNNFMLFFVEGCIDESGTGPFFADCGTKDMLVGRFVGQAKGTAVGPTVGTMVRILRLVE